MTDFSAAKELSKELSLEESNSPLAEKADSRILRAQELREKARNQNISSGLSSGLGTLKINEPSKQKAEQGSFTTFEQDNKARKAQEKTTKISPIKIAAITVTIMWVAFCVVYGTIKGIALTPESISAFLSGTFAQPALFWVLYIAMRKSSPQKKDPESDETPTETLKALRRARNGARQEIRDLCGLSKKAEFHMERLAQSLTEKHENLFKVSDEVEKRTSLFDQRTKKSADTLLNSIEQADAKMSALEEISQNGMAQITQLLETLESKQTNIDTLAQRRTYELEQLDNTLEEKAILLETISKTIQNTARNISEDISGEDIIYQAQNIQKELEDVRAQMEETAQSSFDKMRNAGLAFDNHLENLRDGATEVAALLESSGAKIDIRTQDIKDTSSLLHTNIEEIAESLKDHNSDIHLFADQAIVKIEKMQDAVSSQVLDLSHTITEGASRMIASTEEFGDRTKDIGTAIDHTHSRLEDLGNMIRTETVMLSEASQTIFTDAKDVGTYIHESAENLLLNTKDTLNEIRQSGENVNKYADKLENRMVETLEVTHTYGAELEKQTMMIGSASKQAQASLYDAVTRLKTSMNEIGLSANDASVHIEDSAERMTSEGERLLSISTAALEGVQDAGKIFGKQADALSKAAQNAEQASDTLEKTQIRKKQSAFVGSAKFIVESLYSMTVDISRMLEGEISEKTWKEFKKGNVAAFTHRLNALSPSLPLDQSRRKYQNDTEFRTYVQRFMRQFEEMYEQAVENDHGALMSTALGSSDLAKLYAYLTLVAEQSSCLDAIAKKSA